MFQKSTYPQREVTAAGVSLSKTMESASTLDILNRFSVSSNAFMEATSMRAPELDWQFAIRSWNAMVGGSGWNPNPAGDPLFSSLFSSERAKPANERLEESVILLVEDNPGDVLLVREALREHGLTNELLVLTDGERAVEFIEKLETDKDAICPAIVILDLNLPKRTGHEVLKRMRQSDRCQQTPVVILSSSDALVDRQSVADLNISGYIRKPSTLDEFLMIGAFLGQLLAPDSELS